MFLKTELKELDFDNQSSLHNYDVDSLIEKMLNHIGSTDPELRDTLIYSTFAKLIMGDYLSPKQMEHIMEVCLDPYHLYFKIGEQETDTVFTRSFSVLVMALITEKDRLSHFLKRDILNQAFEASIDYLNREQDIRGFVKGKGWAHSTAHGADLLAEVITHPSFSIERFQKCLDTIKECLFKESAEGFPYMDDEGERLIFPIEAMLERGLDEDRLICWTSELYNELTDTQRKEGYSLNFFRKRTNIIGFLRGLYFRLMYKNQCETLCRSLLSLLEQAHTQVYRFA
jgi:hypothetical protein